jgi:hypothetical protein
LFRPTRSEGMPRHKIPVRPMNSRSPWWGIRCFNRPSEVYNEEKGTNNSNEKDRLL